MAVLTFVWIWSYRWTFLVFRRRQRDKQNIGIENVMPVFCKCTTSPFHLYNRPYGERQFGKKTNGQREFHVDNSSDDSLMLDVTGIQPADTRDKSDNPHQQLRSLAALYV